MSYINQLNEVNNKINNEVRELFNKKDTELL